MDTSVGYRAPRAPRVPLDEVMIRLAPEGFQEEFEADGLNVGVGGLSVRAAVLPEVGSRLRCDFEASDEGGAIEVVGEVVWAHESGPYMGEFGVRFSELAEPDYDRIAEIVYRWQQQTRVHPEQSPTVTLALEGVASPIVATLMAENETGIEVEQPLPFLAIGTEVQNETTGRPGRLAGVELRVERETPRLVLTIGYDEGELSADEGARDTIPDAQEPLATEPEAPRLVAVAQPTTIEKSTPPQWQHWLTVARRGLRASVAWGRSRSLTLWAWLKTATGHVRHLVFERIYPSMRDAIVRASQVSVRFVSALYKKLRGEPPRRQQRRRGEPVKSRTGRRVFRLGLAAIAVCLVVTGTVWLLRADEGAPAFEPAPPEAAPSVKSKPVAPKPEPKATAVASAEPTEPIRVDGMVFGEKTVPNGAKFVLRMSNPVQRIEGVAESKGFSVTIPRSLSLSRAGPIASEHPDVERAMILNRGDYSEFTVRFVEGRAPAYRVEAVGATLEVTIER